MPAALAGLRLPLFAAPMFLVSGPDLVIAACRAGIVGAFPTTNVRTARELDEWMRRTTEALSGGDPAVAPWCANLVTHSTNGRLPEDLALVAKYRPPVVVTALGSPAPAIETVHDYGGLVIADVSSVGLARKAVDAGADGLACICAGAGGHTGSLNPFAFVSAVREFFAGPLVIGGGITDGWGLAGAIACGADYVYMGTRFIATDESLASPAYKQMLVASGIDDLVVSAGITGTPASWLKPSLVANGIDPETLPAQRERSYDGRTAITARRWLDVWTAGQGVGAVRAIEPVARVVARIEREYRAALARIDALRADGTARGS